VRETAHHGGAEERLELVEAAAVDHPGNHLIYKGEKEVRWARERERRDRIKRCSEEPEEGA